MSSEEKLIRNASIGWIPCTEEAYPDFSEEPTVIAYWSETDNTWYYWFYDDCPYGWNVLCRSDAYFRKLIAPVK